MNTKEFTVEELFNYQRKGSGDLVKAYEAQQERIVELEQQNRELAAHVERLKILALQMFGNPSLGETFRARIKFRKNLKRNPATIPSRA